MPLEIKQEPAPIDRSIACDECRALAGRGGYVRVLRRFRTPTVLNIGTVTWELDALCRIRLSPPNTDESGDWGYPKHAYLEHPESRNTYALLCTVRDKVGRRD